MKLWKDNKIGQEYNMSIAEIVRKYFDSPISTHRHYGSDTVRLSIFIADHEYGLGSVYGCNDPDLSALLNAVKDVKSKVKHARYQGYFDRKKKLNTNGN